MPRESRLRIDARPVGVLCDSCAWAAWSHCSRDGRLLRGGSLRVVVFSCLIQPGACRCAGAASPFLTELLPKEDKVEDNTIRHSGGGKLTALEMRPSTDVTYTTTATKQSGRPPQCIAQEVTKDNQVALSQGREGKKIGAVYGSACKVRLLEYSVL